MAHAQSSTWTVNVVLFVLTLPLVVSLAVVARGFAASQRAIVDDPFFVDAESAGAAANRRKRYKMRMKAIRVMIALAVCVFQAASLWSLLLSSDRRRQGDLPAVVHESALAVSTFGLLDLSHLPPPVDAAVALTLPVIYGLAAVATALLREVATLLLQKVLREIADVDTLSDGGRRPLYKMRAALRSAGQDAVVTLTVVFLIGSTRVVSGTCFAIIALFHSSRLLGQAFGTTLCVLFMILAAAVLSVLPVLILFKDRWQCHQRIKLLCSKHCERKLLSLTRNIAGWSSVVLPSESWLPCQLICDSLIALQLEISVAVGGSRTLWLAQSFASVMMLFEIMLLLWPRRFPNMFLLRINTIIRVSLLLSWHLYVVFGDLLPEGWKRSLGDWAWPFFATFLLLLSCHLLHASCVNVKLAAVEKDGSVLKDDDIAIVPSVSPMASFARDLAQSALFFVLTNREEFARVCEGFTRDEHACLKAAAVCITSGLSEEFTFGGAERRRPVNELSQRIVQDIVKTSKESVVSSVISAASTNSESGSGTDWVAPLPLMGGPNPDGARKKGWGRQYDNSDLRFSKKWFLDHFVPASNGPEDSLPLGASASTPKQSFEQIISPPPHRRRRSGSSDEVVKFQKSLSNEAILKMQLPKSMNDIAVNRPPIYGDSSNDQINSGNQQASMGQDFTLQSGRVFCPSEIKSSPKSSRRDGLRIPTMPDMYQTSSSISRSRSTTKSEGNSEEQAQGSPRSRKQEVAGVTTSCDSNANDEATQVTPKSRRQEVPSAHASPGSQVSGSACDSLTSAHENHVEVSLPQFGREHAQSMLPGSAPSHQLASAAPGEEFSPRVAPLDLSAIRRPLAHFNDINNDDSSPSQCSAHGRDSSSNASVGDVRDDAERLKEMDTASTSSAGTVDKDKRRNEAAGPLETLLRENMESGDNGHHYRRLKKRHSASKHDFNALPTIESSRTMNINNPPPRVAKESMADMIASRDVVVTNAPFPAVRPVVQDTAPDIAPSDDSATNSPMLAEAPVQTDAACKNPRDSIPLLSAMYLRLADASPRSSLLRVTASRIAKQLSELSSMPSVPEQPVPEQPPQPKPTLKRSDTAEREGLSCNTSEVGSNVSYDSSKCTNDLLSSVLGDHGSLRDQMNALRLENAKLQKESDQMRAEHNREKPMATETHVESAGSPASDHDQSVASGEPQVDVVKTGPQIEEAMERIMAITGRRRAVSVPNAAEGFPNAEEEDVQRRRFSVDVPTSVTESQWAAWKSRRARKSAAREGPVAYGDWLKTSRLQELADQSGVGGAAR
eukprot:TRINITY_DN14855_c0_g3_i1.p1 TRINITY_DN14855_c0_g3~~TRINITY_DN14855_c0_g3_i1.p1  ORF type:complete len:1302 (-),score=153.15 TRINITY_DN14855_c0_g3_i1:49-3933(-)